METVVGIFMASLAGSPHCAAMCGPFLAFAAAADEGPPGRRPLRLGAYHAGRLSAYVTVGLVAGALGSGVERVGAVAGVARAAAIVAGTVMVIWGAGTVVALSGRRIGVLHPPAALQRALHGVVRSATTMRPWARAAVTGLASALLPCGWLYAFAAAAGGTASPWRAALVMIVFWTGTLPVMVTLGAGLVRLAGPLRQRLPVVTASAVVVIGLLTITGRLRPPTLHAPSADVHAAHR